MFSLVSEFKRTRLTLGMLTPFGCRSDELVSELLSLSLQQAGRLFTPNFCAVLWQFCAVEFVGAVWNPAQNGATHAAEFWQERRADDAVAGGRVRPAKGARSCHQNECLRKSAFKVGLLP